MIHVLFEIGIEQAFTLQIQFRLVSRGEQNY